MNSRLLIAVVLTLASAAFAQTPDEVATWMRSIGAKFNSSTEPTPEIVLKSNSVTFDSVAKDKLLVADLAKLKGIPKLTRVSLGNKAATDELVAELVRVVPNLEYLNLGYSTVSDKAFPEIGKLSKLRELKCMDLPITAAAMVPIGKLPSLQQLDVSKTAIGDDGLEALKGSTITNLWFNTMKGVTKKGVAAIAAMPKLTNLVLQFAEINGEVEELGKSKSLKEITFMSSTLDDVGGVQLAKIKTLENLFLWSTKVTDKTMEAISTLPLKVLYLGNTPITDAGLKPLAKIKTLETLWIDRTAVGDKGLANLANHPGLRWVKADETKLTDGCVASLLTMPALSTFDGRKTTMTDKGIDQLKAKFPKGRFSK
jgi:Leucine-rich repeat (LRR) protein